MERVFYNIKQTKERNSRIDAQIPHISNKLNIKLWIVIVYTHPLETKTANNTYLPVTKGDQKWDTLPQNQTPNKLFSVLP